MDWRSSPLLLGVGKRSFRVECQVLKSPSRPCHLEELRGHVIFNRAVEELVAYRGVNMNATRPLLTLWTYKMLPGTEETLFPSHPPRYRATNKPTRRKYLWVMTTYIVLEESRFRITSFSIGIAKSVSSFRGSIRGR